MAATVSLKVVRCTDASFPGFVECELTDAEGKVWVFGEKAPFVTEEYCDFETPYPLDGRFWCDVVERRGDRVRVFVSPLLGDVFMCWVAAGAVVTDGHTEPGAAADGGGT